MLMLSAEWGMTFMLSVGIDPIVLSVIMLDIVMLSVVTS
jgi:hypothetical protein